MQLYERIKQLAQGKKLTIAELEREIGISNGQIRKWQNQTPGVDKIKLVADYFGVTTDYLLGRTDTPQFTRKDERDIQRMLDEMINGLSDKNCLSYMKNGGEELDEEAAELLRDSLERTARRAKLLAKEKFTPKKYRKDNNAEWGTHLCLEKILEKRWVI